MFRKVCVLCECVATGVTWSDLHPRYLSIISHTHAHTHSHTSFFHISTSIYPCAIFSVLWVSYPFPRHAFECTNWSMQNVPDSRDKMPSFIFPEEDPSIEEKRRQSNKRTSALPSLIFQLHKQSDDLSMWRRTLDHIYSSFCQII